MKILATVNNLSRTDNTTDVPATCCSRDFKNRHVFKAEDHGQLTTPARLAYSAEAREKDRKCNEKSWTKIKILHPFNI
jgi:hypothetical protein